MKKQLALAFLTLSLGTHLGPVRLHVPVKIGHHETVKRPRETVYQQDKRLDEAELDRCGDLCECQRAHDCQKGGR